ncbi:MAG: branched-chain amino acid ABC transporter permease [Gammaproteobacteria bacterium]|nr:branched-chain amino acid ABC transporter permease [Gammaproteobacteria bacterium]MCZ6771525.1 branched-chain amino acid ABC transporter permease [Pseudomonadota bacterium]
MLLVQILINGILLGGLYACMAIGFSLIWGVMNIINLAHGSMIVLGAYITYLITTHTGIDPFLTLPAAGAVLFLLGYALQKHLINRVVQASIFMTLILTFGLDMVMINVNLALFTADVRSITPSYANLAFQMGTIRVPYTRLGVFVLALALTGALYVFLKRTKVGRAIQATSQDPRAAQIVGIDTERIYAITFGVGACMAGLAGSLVAVIYTFSPVVGDSFTMKSFVIVVLGGLGSIPGAIFAGVFLGVAENLVSGLWDPGYTDAVSFALLVLVLVLRRKGFLGR